MKPLFPQILELLTSPQGSLIYHLILAFSILATLQAAWIVRRANAVQYVDRLVFGLCMLLVGQIVLFVSSGLAWQQLISADVYLAPLDRAVILFSLIWLVWLWNFPTPARLGDMVTGILNLVVVILFVFTLSSWSGQGANQAFNDTTLDWIWVLASGFILLLGMLLLVLTRPAGWGYGLGMLALCLVGVVAHLLYIRNTGNLSGYLRLGMLASFPLLASLLYRVSEPVPAAAPVGAEPPLAQERRRYSSSSRTVRAWLEVNEATEPQTVLTGIAKGIAHTMLADMCFLVSEPSYGHIVLQSGYDLIQEEAIRGTMLEMGQLPALSGAVQRGNPLRITAEDPQPPDMKALSAALGVKEAGSLMYLPLELADKPAGGLLFLTPYTNRQWRAGDQDYLSDEFDLIASILRRTLQNQQRTMQPDGGLTPKPEVKAAQGPTPEQIGAELRAEISSLREENQRLAAELGQVTMNRAAAQPVTPAPAPAMELSALVAIQKEAQDQIDHLQAENERLQSALKDQGISVLSPEEFNRLEGELRATLQEIAKLQNQLAESNARNMMLEHELEQSGGINEDREVVISIVQEIRQPMSSIIGYSELLLSETGGILGALQRKFLERIRASTERMHSMLDDLIQVATMEEGPMEILPQEVDMEAIMDGAIMDTQAQIREKNIALRVDIPEDMPQVNADRDAIQQIVLHLLQNAGTVTPPEGTITMRARIQNDDKDEYLLMQVTDTGGGIHPEDLPKVFTRRYRADMPLIEGLGDTGVGLSIAKALAEAHGGRIWVDSVPGESTTFSVLLPIRPVALDSALE